MGTLNIGAGSIGSEDDPIAARNLSFEAARTEITQQETAAVFKEEGYDPYAIEAVLESGPAATERRRARQAKIDERCRARFKAEGLLP